MGGNWGTFRSITGHRLVQRGRREMGEGGGHYYNRWEETGDVQEYNRTQVSTEGRREMGEGGTLI